MAKNASSRHCLEPGLRLSHQTRNIYQSFINNLGIKESVAVNLSVNSQI